MGIIEYYIIFCLTTALSCCYLFLWPVIKEAKELGVVNEFTEYPYFSCFVYIVLSALIAPILILPFLSNEKSEQFKNGLRNTIINDK